MDLSSKIKKANRLLAAIMFTDMVGYTALMQENEAKAKSNRDRHRKVLIWEVLDTTPKWGLTEAPLYILVLHL